MEKLKIEEILEATKGHLICGENCDKNIEISAISTDSRNIIKDCLFIPLIGEKFDGHDFIWEAFDKGALACLTQKNIYHNDRIMIKVDNTLEALQNISKYYKNKFNIPFIAVTGSVGKTTTKDMIACVLEQKYNTLKTEGNFNNHIGLPLTLLNINHSTQIGVVEMGMNNFGEIERLSNIVCPDTGVITKIGVSHIGNLGSQENILKAKLEIISGMSKNGNIILNADDPLLVNLSLPIKNIYYFSINSKKGIYPYNIEENEYGTKYCLKINNKEYIIELPVPGKHNIYNSLAAVQVGIIYGVPMEYIVKGIKNFKSGKMRQNIITLKGNVRLIEDCYNASPDSMEAAFSVLSKMEGQRKIAVLGDMLELGEYTEKGHEQIGEFAAKNVDYLFLIGNYKLFVKNGATKNGMDENKIFCFEDKQELSEYLKNFIEENDIILVKGSRGMRMEHIVSSLCEVK